MEGINLMLKKLTQTIIERNKSIAFLFIVIVFVPIIIYGQNYTSPSYNEGVIQDNSIIIPENTIYSLEPGHYIYIHVLIPYGIWNLQGAITASTYVFFYIVNNQEFFNLTHDLPYHQIFYAFANSDAIINTNLELGSYYLVFYNQNKEWGVGVEVTSPFYFTHSQ